MIIAQRKLEDSVSNLLSKIECVYWFFLELDTKANLNVMKDTLTLWVKVSDLGRTDNPNTTPTKDYEKASGGVPPWYQR